MRKRIITTMAVWAAGFVLSTFGQNSSSTAGGASTDQSTSPAGSSTFDHTRRWPTGRMGQETRASKLMNAEVKSSQSQTLGMINDLVLNPSSGRIDFAVISVNSSASSTTPSTTATPSATSTISSDGSSGGKLVAVPWALLRSSSSSATTSSSSVSGVGTSSSSLGQQTFVFAGDASKLQSAPSFDQSNWPDISQYSWRQSIYSHFGMTAGSSTGGATSPGGTESSTGSSSSSTTPGSINPTPPSPSSPDNSSGK